MAKGKFVKIIATIASIAVIAGGSIFAYNTFIKGPDTPVNPDPGPGPVVTVVQLETPEQVAFNSENYVLTWDEVDNASAYTIYYNGEETTVDANDTQEQITITAEDNVFKVKAVGDGAHYSDSEWSEEVTYSIEQNQDQDQQQSVFEKVNLKVAQIAQERGLKLESIIGISSVNLEGDDYGDHIVFQTICSKNGVSSNYELSFKNEGHTASIEDLLNNFDSAVFGNSSKDTIVDFDSAQYLLNSGAYDGHMEELKNQGYEISVVSSAVREGSKVGSKFRFEIVGTYRAERDGDVKYFTSTNRIDILNPSTKESRNYQDSLEFEDLRTVTETAFMEHEAGGTLEYMNEWAVRNSASASASAVSYKITVPFYGNKDDGMEM